MRHTCRHTCAHGGGGCCVRSEGAVGVLSEFFLGFLAFTLRRVGVTEKWSAAAVCEHIRLGYTVCVCVNEGVEQNRTENIVTDHTDPHHPLSELSFLLCLHQCEKLQWSKCGSRSSFFRDTWLDAGARQSLDLMAPKSDIMWETGNRCYINLEILYAVYRSNRRAHKKHFPP